MRSFSAAFVVLVACGPSTTVKPTLPSESAAQASDAGAGAAAAQAAKRAFDYPVARIEEVVDDYHGEKVADPYRWMEDLDSPELAEWVAAENALTFAWLAEVPARDAIRARLTRLWNYERHGLPARHGKRYFFQKNDGLQNQAVLYVADSLDGEPRVLIDPNTLSADGTVALGGTFPSFDGKRLAYSVATAGSDWTVIKVRDVATGKDLADEIHWVKFSGAAWTRDGKGFFYARYDEPREGQALEDANYYQKLYFHEIGKPQADDTLVYRRDDAKEWGFSPSVSEDGRYLVVTIGKGTAHKNQVFYKDLKAKNGKLVELVRGFDHQMWFLGNVGTRFYFRTDMHALRGRVIAIDVKKAGDRGLEHVDEIVPEGAEAFDAVTMVGGRIVVEVLKDATSLVRVYEPSGKLVREQALPGLGSVAGLGGWDDDPESFFTFSSYTTPSTVYRLDVKTGESKVWRAPTVDFDPAGFESTQVFVASKDGTQVPMIIVHKKGLVLDGNNPTILYGYGGFKISMTPAFSVGALVWMEMGGVYAVANLRGGGEYGEAWHAAGTKLLKQNVFDDFIAAAVWLQEQRYTSRDKLAISGGSNGGLLVGACMTQRPELFGAALPNVGVLDMLRYHKYTIGWAWADDYGTADDPAEFAALHAYSPYHNIKPGTKYPPTLITTADHDDRVVPAHSFKFAARLQAAQGGDAPVFIRVDVRAGHGAGKPTKKLIEQQTDVYAFLVRALGVRVP